MWYFVCILRIDPGGNYTVRTIINLWMPQEAPPILLLYPKRLMKHLNSNGYLYIQYIIPFPVQGRYPHMWYYVCILRVGIGRIDSMWTIRGLQMLSGAPPTSLTYLRKSMEHFMSNECFSLQHYIPFPVMIRSPKSGIFVCNLRVDLGRNDMAWTIRGLVDDVRSLSHLPYASKEDYEPLQ